MKKFFSLVLALVMTLSLATVAWGVTIDTAVTTGTRDNASYSVGVQIAADGVYDGADYDGVLNFTAVPSTLNGNEWDTAIEMLGSGTVKNVVINCATRGIVCWANGVTVNIENVDILNSNRPVNITANTASTLNVSDSAFAGKISYQLAGGTATFTNCEFVVTEGLLKGNVLEPRDTTVFVNCDFEAGFELSFEDFPAAAEMTLTNCTYAGEPVTETNFARLFGLSAADAAMVTEVTSDSTAATYDLYEGDGDLHLDGAFRTKVAAKKLTKTQAGQVAGWDIEGTLYVEINKSEATNGDYYLTNHGKDKAILYLREAANHGVYTLTGKAYDNFNEGDDNCGEWNYDPELVAMYKDDVDGDIYTDLGATAYMLVGKTVVGVALADEANMIGHTMEGVYDAKDELVSVKCVVCGATGKFYEDAADAPIGADVEPFGTVGYYVLNKVAVKPSTDKVQSAETFDAGIAMYVGMSVMAAAGSAVVLKKKD